MTLEQILGLSAAVTGAILGWIAIVKPVCRWWQNKRTKRHDAAEKILSDGRIYRQTVLDKLNSIETQLMSVDISVAELQRDNIERAYCMFVVEHNYCPSGMKESIEDMFQSYKARGYNHIAQERVDQILKLPEFPPLKGV